MPTITRITLDEALEQTRTGDIWLFRGHTLADRAIRVGTNSPVNHVGMSVVIEDLPPLMWHAELGRSLEDLWSGTRQRGVQLHDLRAAVGIWTGRYHQDAWLRQLEHPPLPGMEDALLRTIARLDGTPFPSTTRLAGRWLLGRLPALPRVRLGAGLPDGSQPGSPAEDSQGPDRALETAYCAPPEKAKIPRMGKTICRSVRRTDRTGPTFSGRLELKIAASRVMPPSTISSYTTSALSMPYWG